MRKITKKDTIINANIEIEKKDLSLEEIKKTADKSFKNINSNKKKIIGVTLGAVGLAAIGTVTPIAVYNANKEISVLVQSVNVTANKYKVKVKQGTKIKDIKIVELDGYEFVGYFKDEACTKPFKLTDELKKNTTIYASYKLKAVEVKYTVYVNGEAINIPSFSNITIGDAIKEITTLPYETSGVVYLDEACTQEADLNSKMTPSTTLYTKAATLDKLSFIWNEATSSWSVQAKGETTSGDVVIPEKYAYGTRSGSVTIVGGFTYINNVLGLQGCSITSIEIPNSVTTVGGLNMCDRLTSIKLGNNVTTIEDCAFQYCGNLKTITIPNSVTTIGEAAFQGCYGLTEITIGSGVTTIEQSTFSSCGSLTEITIPNSVTTIGKSAFSSCGSLTSITIPNSVTTIGEECFSGCSSLTEIAIPSSVTTIEKSAFYNCSNLTSITIPNSVTTIGDSLFSGCVGLINVTIGSGVTTIGDSLFSGCNRLTSITVDEGNAKYHSSGNCIIETANKTLIKGCKTSIIPSDGSVTTIESKAFSGCSGLTEIKIPNSVITIEERAFSGCSGLTSVIIGDGVTTIRERTFYECGELINVIIGNNVTTIGDCAFYNCSNLTSIEIPNSVTTIGNYAFYLCSGLTSITIGKGVTTIVGSAFTWCCINTVIIDSETIANISSDSSMLMMNCDTVYIKTGIEMVNSTYINNSFTKQTTSDKAGYDKWVRN